MAELFTAENLLALVTLTSLEIVLGIDNVVFIAILTGKLEASKQAKARQIGLLLAMGMRIVLLLTIAWIMRLTGTLFTITAFDLNHAVSGRDLIMLLGGLFLIAKATYEIHDKIEAEGDHGLKQKAIASFGQVLIQIVMIDIVFSLDSVITAVGMVNEVAIMIVAVMIAVGVMMIFAGRISRFIERHPTLKMLALSFLLLIGVMLTAEAFHVHVPKGYIYFAMAFSLFVEVLNIRVRKPKRAAVAAE
jgi:predicted tellurium resistance membrane protein TerC